MSEERWHLLLGGGDLNTFLGNAHLGALYRMPGIVLRPF